MEDAALLSAQSEGRRPAPLLPPPCPSPARTHGPCASRFPTSPLPCPHPAAALPPARSLRMYNSLVEKCFRDCVDSFRRKDLDAAEEKVRGAGAGAVFVLPGERESCGAADAAACCRFGGVVVVVVEVAAQGSASVRCGRASECVPGGMGARGVLRVHSPPSCPSRPPPSLVPCSLPFAPPRPPHRCTAPYRCCSACRRAQPSS